MQRFFLPDCQPCKAIAKMKNFIIGCLLFISLSAVVISCSKDPAVSASPALVLSKSVVKLGEPLVVTTRNHTLGASIHWSVSPSTNSWTSASGDSATFVFSQPGNYQVIAASATDSSSSRVSVNDSIYTDTVNVRCNLLQSVPISAGDQVILTPIAYSDSAGLVLLAHTQNAYTSYPILVYGGNFSGVGGSLECDFNSITEYPCNGPGYPTPAMTDVFFNSLADGTYTLVFKLNGTTYQGSMTVSNASVIFNWNYTSGVTISPLTIQKI
jgi:hypothetical protein